MGPFDPRRRRFIAGMASWAAAGLSGCTMPDIHLCESSISDLSLPLGIDVHSHVFNGTDLQIGEFFGQVVANSVGSELQGIVTAVGSLLQDINWHTAPRASEEIGRLAGLKTIYSACDATTKSSIDEAREMGYQAGRRALLDARDQAARRKALAPSTNDALEELLQPTYAQWKAKRDVARKARLAADSGLAAGKSITGAIDFVLHNFNYRHVNVLDYLETYSQGARRKIDLLVPSLVDYDWWLARGSGTPSSLDDQVAAMERISVLTRGRVHGFVPFCPFRETMGAGTSMNRVKDAIGNRGFIGVKLYPPMGFAPYNNTGRTVWADHPGSLPDDARLADFGARLDAAMKGLFDWCRANDVPVMAHTNHSNGPNPAFEDLAGPERWGDALRAFPGLRVNFGHFGDCDAGGGDPAKLKAFLALMSGPGGGRAYGDSGYFDNVLPDPDGVHATLARLYGEPATSLIASRFMYGTDWEMILQEREVDSYFDRFMDLMDGLDPDAFFGRNAAAFLGLGRGERNRARLDAFYDRNGVSQPDWIAKVDKLS